jgi:superoxide reductase
MTTLRQVYKCNVCGNIVEVLHTGAGTLVCCGQPMVLQQENTVDAAVEKFDEARAMAGKHVPTVEKADNGFKIKIGSTLHPMEEAHYIEWIELMADGVSYRKMLKPGDKPEAEFNLQAEKAEVRAYCNVHGLWKSS